MDYLVETFTKNGVLHHAYFIEGNKEETRPKLLAFISETVAIPIQGNADFSHDQFTSFTIDDARNLRDRQANKAFGENRKVFIVEADTMTLEAQNAMLKILEEPTPQTHFFIMMPSRELVLPTVRSRLMIISHATQATTSSETVTFLKATPAERLKLVAPIIEEKDRSKAIRFIDGLITELHRKKKVQHLSNLIIWKGYLNDRSPSYKLILEHVALTLPML